MTVEVSGGSIYSSLRRCSTNQHAFLVEDIPVAAVYPKVPLSADADVSSREYRANPFRGGRRLTRFANLQLRCAEFQRQEGTQTALYAPTPRRPLQNPPPVARSNSPTDERQDGRDDYALTARLATRSAASFSRQLLPSNFNKCPRCMSRSRSGVTTTTSPRSFGQSSMVRLDVMSVESFS